MCQAGLSVGALFPAAFVLAAAQRFKCALLPFGVVKQCDIGGEDHEVDGQYGHGSVSFGSAFLSVINMQYTDHFCKGIRALIGINREGDAFLPLPGLACNPYRCMAELTACLVSPMARAIAAALKPAAESSARAAWVAGSVHFVMRVRIAWRSQ